MGVIRRWWKGINKVSLFFAMLLCVVIGVVSTGSSKPAHWLKVSMAEYGEKWPFNNITVGWLECINNAVVLHTDDHGTWNLNGKAMQRYENKYQTAKRNSDPKSLWRKLGATDFIQRGLVLCR